MGQRHAQGFGRHLAARRRAHELAAPAGRTAGLAAHFRRVFQSDLPVGEAGGQRLHLGRVLRLLGHQHHAARHEDAGQVAHARQGHHHRRQAFVTGGDADDAPAGGKRADQAAEDDGGVVAVGQAVEHPLRAIGPSVAGIAAIARKGYRPGGGEGPRRLFHQESDFPVAGVIAQSHGRAVGTADAAMGAEDEKFLAQELARVPAHARILREPEHPAARGILEHLRGERKLPGRTGPASGGCRFPDRPSRESQDETSSRSRACR